MAVELLAQALRRLRVSEPLALETTEERDRLGRRIWAFEAIVTTVVVVLVLGFWHLQLVRGPYYTRLADENLLRRVRVRPPRGLVLDRNGDSTRRASQYPHPRRDGWRERAGLFNRQNCLSFRRS